MAPVFSLAEGAVIMMRVFCEQRDFGVNEPLLYVLILLLSTAMEEVALGDCGYDCCFFVFTSTTLLAEAVV